MQNHWYGPSWPGPKKHAHTDTHIQYTPRHTVHPPTDALSPHSRQHPSDDLTHTVTLLSCRACGNEEAVSKEGSGGGRGVRWVDEGVPVVGEPAKGRRGRGETYSRVRVPKELLV